MKIRIGHAIIELADVTHMNQGTGHVMVYFRNGQKLQVSGVKVDENLIQEIRKCEYGPGFLEEDIG